MENKTSRIHPLVAGAAVSVMLVSLVGVAAITGVIPSSHSTSAPTAVITPTQPATAPATAAASLDANTNKVAAAETQPAPAAKPAPVVKHSRPVKHSAPAKAPATAATQPSQQVAAAPICETCGRIESVQAVTHQAKPSGVGVVGGAVLGGLLGNQIGNGNGRTLATVAGAVGGGYAGNEVEKRTRATTSWEVRVRMEDGTLRTFPYATQPGWNTGERVKIVNGALTSQA
jgi:outer membrane lipoprotein SlyB